MCQDAIARRKTKEPNGLRVFLPLMHAWAVISSTVPRSSMLTSVRRTTNLSGLPRRPAHFRLSAHSTQGAQASPADTSMAVHSYRAEPDHGPSGELDDLQTFLFGHVGQGLKENLRERH
jgi:hypothetical protein